MRFIDLFAGIGGMRLAFENAGATCVFSCEIDKACGKTYFANFGDTVFPDIRELKTDLIPPYDILVAGFPCQPFSLAGISKRNTIGQQSGWDMPEKGDLFFQVLRIVKETQPRAIFLENVKNLRTCMKGEVLRRIISCLEDTGYSVSHQVFDAAAFVPQHRERVFIVGVRKKRFSFLYISIGYSQQRQCIHSGYFRTGSRPKILLV